MAKAPQKPSANDYGAEETALRRDEAVRRALNTPPPPHAALSSGEAKSGAKKRSAKKLAKRHA